MTLPNKTITLPDINIGANEGIIDLPEVNIEAHQLMPEAPTGQVKVINPNGEEGYLPIDWFLKEGVGKGYTLPPTKEPTIDPIDLTPDKQIKVVKINDGSIGTLPLDWYLSNPNAKNYVPESKYDPEHQKIVDEDLKDLQEKHLFSDVNDSPITARHANDDLQDQEGNYKLISPDGTPTTIDGKYVAPLLKAGFKFKDDNAQALFDAYRKRDEGIEGKVKEFTSGESYELPGVKTLLSKAYLGDPNANILHKFDLINQDIINEDSALFKAGQVTSMGIQLLSPKGLFGEMKLGQAAKAGIIAKLAPEGASFGRTLLAKGLGMGLEGAIISSPQAIAQAAIEENPKAAAETLALGFGIGAGLGVGGEILSKSGQAAFGYAGKISAKINENKVNDILESAGIGKTRELTERQAERGVVSAGEKLEHTITQDKKFIQTLQEEGIKKTSNADDILDVSRKLMQGNGMESTLSKLDKLGSSGISASELITKFKASTQQFVKDFPEISENLLGKFNKKLEELATDVAKMADKEGMLSLENTKKFITNIGEDINWKKLRDSFAEAEERVFSPLDELKSYLWNDAREALLNGADKLVESADAKLVAEWSEKRLMQKMSHALFSETAMAGANAELRPLANKIMDILAAKGADKLGAIAGSAAGTVLGPAGYFGGGLIGNAAGKALNKLAGPIANAGQNLLIEAYEKNSDSKLVNWIVRNKTANAIGSYVTIDAVKNMESKIANIPDFIKDIGQTAKVAGIKIPAGFIGAQDPIKTILGPEANGLSKNQQLRRLSDQLSKTAGSPEIFDHNFNLHIAPLFKDHPELVNQLYTDYQQKVKVLNDIVNAYQTKEPAAFQGKEKPYQPTTSQMKEIESLLKVAINPYALMQAVKEGRITAKQVDVVNQLNPAILQQMRQKIVEEAYSGNAKLPYQQRMSLSVLMGAPMDPSLKNGSAMQAIYATAQPQQTQKTKSSGNSKSLKADKIAGYTASQRISKL